MTDKTTSNQDVPTHKPNGDFAEGNKANPDGKGGFKDNPENRSDGRWSKEGSISYQYNMLMRLTTKELEGFEPVTVAQEIALTRIRQAKGINGLADAKEVTDRTEGRAPQSLDLTSGGDKIKTIALVEFLDDDSQDEGTDT